MKIKIVRNYEGLLNGNKVPFGEVVDLPKEDAEWLLNNKIAEPVKDEKTEKAAAPKPKEKAKK